MHSGRSRKMYDRNLCIFNVLSLFLPHTSCMPGKFSWSVARILPTSGEQKKFHPKWMLEIEKWKRKTLCTKHWKPVVSRSSQFIPLEKNAHSKRSVVKKEWIVMNVKIDAGRNRKVQVSNECIMCYSITACAWSQLLRSRDKENTMPNDLNLLLKLDFLLRTQWQCCETSLFAVELFDACVLFVRFRI